VKIKITFVLTKLITFVILASTPRQHTAADLSQPTNRPVTGREDRKPACSNAGGPPTRKPWSTSPTRLARRSSVPSDLRRETIIAAWIQHSDSCRALQHGGWTATTAATEQREERVDVAGGYGATDGAQRTHHQPRGERRNASNRPYDTHENPTISRTSTAQPAPDAVTGTRPHPRPITKAP